MGRHLHRLARIRIREGGLRPGELAERMELADEEMSLWPHHARCLEEHRSQVVNVLEDETGNDDVDRGGGHGPELADVVANESDIRRHDALMGARGHAFGEIERR